MRHKLPVIWFLQFAILMMVGINNFLHPIGTLEFHRGRPAPHFVDLPKDSLYRWILSIEEMPVPNRIVKEFFVNHNQKIHDDRNVWTPHDKSIAKFLTSDPLDRESADVHNKAWEEVEDWIMSGQPAPPDHDKELIRTWLDSIDEMPAASKELAAWVAGMKTPQPPELELKMMILDARQTHPISWQLASDQVRLSAPCVVACGLFTLLGLMTPSIRRPLARVFVIIAIFWTLARLRSSTGPPEWNLTYGVLMGGLIFGIAMVVTALRAVPRLATGSVVFATLLLWWVGVVIVAACMPYSGAPTLARIDTVIGTSLVAVFGIANAYYWLIGKNEDPPQDDGGIAQRRPPQLWTTWLIQFVILILNGLLALIYPGWIAELFINSQYDYLTTDIVDDSVRVLGSWIIAMAMFSYFALGVGRDWIWQGIGVIFSVVFLVLATSTIVYGSSGEYTVWAYLYGFQGLVFVPLTVSLLTRKDPWSTENVEIARTDDWNLTDLLVGPIFMWRPLWSGQRALYRHGVAARGIVRVVDATDSGEGEDLIPENEFFRPGREFPIEMRFSNRTVDDDAGLDIRGCALRFSDNSKSPLDLFMATGSFSFATTLSEFRQTMPIFGQRRRILSIANLREGYAAGVRRAPTSFAALTYHDHFTLEWLTPEATHYLVRFRIVPHPSSMASELEQEQSWPDHEDLNFLWRQERRRDETRRTDYLRQEFLTRIREDGGVRFQIQAQFHLPDPNDSLDWYDATLEWDLDECPWQSLADIEVTEAMSTESTERVRFDPNNIPPSLNVPNPSSLAFLSDPRALAAARFRIAHILGRWRVSRHDYRQKKR